MLGIQGKSQKTGGNGHNPVRNERETGYFGVTQGVQNTVLLTPACPGPNGRFLVISGPFRPIFGPFSAILGIISTRVAGRATELTSNERNYPGDFRQAWQTLEFAVFLGYFGHFEAYRGWGLAWGILFNTVRRRPF